MKVTRKTKIKIRKAIAFARNLFLVICGIGMLCTICSVDGPSILFPIISMVIAVVCFGISYLLDKLLWETAWSGDLKSPFNH